VRIPQHPHRGALSGSGDEDLSIRGLLEGNHGQRTKHDESCVVREEPPKPIP
jgi:hypothetical protein